MVEINAENKRMIVKLVYYGPALSGKTTNLMQLHNTLEGQHCGELMTFETKGDRTLFFDLLPLAIKTDSGFTVKIKLFTVPGQVAHDSTRKAVLSRADGIVFVADSQTGQALNNFESFDNLEKNAARVGLDIDHLPLVIQFNKRDLQNIISEDEIMARWGPTELPIVFSSALRGRGVWETFRQLLICTYKNLDEQYSIKNNYHVTQEVFLGILPN